MICISNSIASFENKAEGNFYWLCVSTSYLSLVDTVRTINASKCQKIDKQNESYFLK
jgi:hypothetical protein